MFRLTAALCLVCSALALPAPQAPAAPGTASAVPAASAVAPVNILRTTAPDGSQGFSFQSADGVQRDESRGADGSVRGRYSYIDPSGRPITVNYIADAQGFRATGDHLPGTPLAPQVAPVAQSIAPAQQVHTLGATRQLSPANTVAFSGVPQVLTWNPLQSIAQPTIVGAPASTGRIGSPIVLTSSPYHHLSPLTVPLWG